jgi:hypothetical protein
MRALLALTALCLTMVAADAHAQCMPAEKAGEVQEGRLGQQAVGGERIFVLRIPTPVCLKGRRAHDNVRGTRTIQVYSSNSKVDKEIRRFVGKDVHVVGTAGGANSPSHKMPIVMDLSEIDQI